MRVRHILLPTDFSEAAEPALRRGTDLGKQFGATVHLVHVATLTSTATIDPVFEGAGGILEKLEELEAESERRLAAEGERLGLSAEQSRTTVLRGRWPAPQLLSYAEENAIDLIVLGTHGRQGVRRMILGSVAEALVRKAPCPVWTCHASLPPEATRPERILVPVDFSAHTESLAAHAAALAELYHSEIDLLHVMPDPSVPVVYGGEPVIPLPAREAIEERARRELEAVAQEGPLARVPTRQHLEEGNAALRIDEKAKELGSDLIVMASHGLTGIERLLIGSVTEKVVRISSVPVLTIHSFRRLWLERTD